MTTRRTLGFMAMVFILAFTACAGGKQDIQQYFSNAADKVKATDNPSEKRQILSESFQTMASALDMAQDVPSMSANDLAGIHQLRIALQEKQDELAGHNGYVRVSDERLNAFSDYVVQDMEQADQVITISLITLLLVLILVVLLIK